MAQHDDSPGFQSGSNNTNRLAPTRFRPTPPARDDNRNTNTSLSGALNRSTCHDTTNLVRTGQSVNCSLQSQVSWQLLSRRTMGCRLSLSVLPSKRNQPSFRTVHSSWTKSSTWVELLTTTKRSPMACTWRHTKALATSHRQMTFITNRRRTVSVNSVYSARFLPLA